MQSRSHTSSTLKLIYLTFVERVLRCHEVEGLMNHIVRQSINLSIASLIAQRNSFFAMEGGSQLGSFPVSLLNVNRRSRAGGFNYCVTNLFRRSSGCLQVSSSSSSFFVFSPLRSTFSQLIPFNLIGLISHNIACRLGGKLLRGIKWKFFTSCLSSFRAEKQRFRYSLEASINSAREKKWKSILADATDRRMRSLCRT